MALCAFYFNFAFAMQHDLHVLIDLSHMIYLNLVSELFYLVALINVLYSTFY